MTAAVSIERPRSAVRSGIDDAVSLARRLGKPTLYSRVDQLPTNPDPLAFLDHASRALGSGVLWEQTRAGLAFAGAGAAMAIRAEGPGRFGAVSAAMRDMSERLVRDDEETMFPIVGGFAFAAGNEDGSTSIWRDFPDAMFVVPRVLLQATDGAALVRVTLPIEPGSSPGHVEREMRALHDLARQWARSTLPHPSVPSVVRAESLPGRRAWESSVARAVAVIRQDMLDKVVLAREERLVLDGSVSPASTLARLRAVDPAATRFAAQSGGAWFVGSTPERLVRLENGRVDVTCLAGSIGIGRDEEETRQLAARLLASDKDREEHEIVVRSTMTALEEVCEDVIRLPGTPRVVTARAVQHLETPITGWLAGAGRVLDLVERLHPTPAVGGHPRDVALSLIRELEEMDRGWYAGPFGWTDLDGSGEFAVAIRSALLSGRTASLFAGCGIVAGSDPATEFEESRLKLRPMRSALGAA